MKIFLKKSLLTIIFLISLSSIFAQGKFVLEGKIYNKKKEPLSNVEIQVEENNKTILTLKSDNKGGYSIPFELDKKYKVDINKGNYRTKRFIVNTLVPKHFSDRTFDLFGLIILDKGKNNKNSGIPATIYYFDELSGSFTGSKYDPGVPLDNQTNVTSQKALLKKQKKMIAEAKKMLNEAELIKLQADRYADSIRGLLYKNKQNQNSENEYKYSSAISEALKNSTQSPSDDDFETFFVDKDSFFKDKEVIKLQKRIELLSSTKNKTSLDSLNLKKSKLELRRKLFDFAKYQLELDLLKEASKEDRAKIGQREAELFLMQHEMALAEQEIKNAKNELLLKDIEISKKNVILTSLIAGAILLLVFLSIVYYYYKDKKRINKVLEFQNSELEKLSVVARETSNAIIITDKKGVFTWVNKAYTQLFGYKLEESVGKKAKSIINNKVDESINDLFRDSLVSGKPANYEFETKAKSGEKIWLQSTITPILDENGKVSKMVVIDTDISQVKKAEQEIRQRNKQISMQNRQIISSITYAKNIQNAILPSPNDLDRHFDNFVFFKPKDIVSGDFYWHALLPEKNGVAEKHILAVVDCTGHGVPGAFMSMIGNRLLNEIIREKEIDQPNLILKELNNRVIKALRQEETENNDGMDVCICSLEKMDNNTTKLIFAGAKRPLFVYKSATNELETLKGTRKSIGGNKGSHNKEIFKSNEIILEKNDSIYLSSDGFTDQPSTDRSRFGSKRLSIILKEIATRSTSEQKEILEIVLSDFQKEELQRDDITLIGIKL